MNMLGPARKVFVRHFFLLALLLINGHCSRAQNCPSVDQWLVQMRENGLAFSEETAQLIADHPDTLLLEKQAIAKRYNNIRREIKNQLGCYQSLYKAAKRSEEDAAQVVNQAQQFVEASLIRVIIPLWLGGEWDFNGYTTRPQHGPIACGWFIQRIMMDAGFRIEKSGGRHIAHLAPDQEVSSYADKPVEDLRSWQGLKTYTEHEGNGLYVIGLLSGTVGHMLFLYRDCNEHSQLYHSGISPGGAFVASDDAEYYLTQFFPPAHVWATKIDQRFIIRWLEAKSITAQLGRH